MADVFEGKPDARQTDADATAPRHSLFRARYRQLSVDEVALHDAIKAKADELATLIGRLNTGVASRLGVVPVPIPGEDVIALPAPKDPANVTLAIRHLEDAVYRAVKALTA